MNGLRIAGIVLIVAGVLGLALGSFSWTEKTHEAQVGPIALSVSQEKTVNVPLWAGLAAVVAGIGLLLAGPRR